jgi:hypothetical protein
MAWLTLDAEKLDALTAGMQAVETTVRHDHSKGLGARPNIGLLFGLLIHWERTIGVLPLESETTKTITPICMSVISMGHDLVRKPTVFWGDPKDQYVDDRMSADRAYGPILLEYTDPALAKIGPVLPYL